MASKIIFFELNEVPFKIIDAFVEWRPNSNLANLMPLCKQFSTFAEDVGYLSPWKTSPTVHRGVIDAKHLINDFGQDLSEVDYEYPPVWQMLSRAGISTGVCGSLHTYPMPADLGNYSFFIPDTFAAGSECFPEKLSVYQEFNLQMARESARNVSTHVPWKAALRFLAAAPGLGLTPRTVVDVGSQLISERLAGWRKIRRRTYQVVLAFDVWMKQLRKYRPAFTTFFTNHVASSMHRYWAARFPNEYETFGYDDDWVRTYRNEIDFTMSTFDRFLGRLHAFVNRHPEYALWITTSMGQAATQALPLETQLYIRNIATFMERLGLQETAWQRRPAMLPQYNVFVCEEKREAFRKTISTLAIGGEPIGWREATNGFFSIDLGHRNLAPDTQVTLDGESVGFLALGLENTKIEDRSGASAYHVPHGSLLIYTAGHEGAGQPRGDISTLELAPALLSKFGVTPPGYMQRVSRSMVGLN